MGHPLDDRDFLTRLDPKGMLALTEAFPDQCRRALQIAREAEVPAFEPSLVVLTGLGGSAAGGDFTRAVFEHQGVVPFLVNRDYTLPRYVGYETLVIATSYSGNTEETLSAYADARAKGARLIVATSGGKLAQEAEADGVPVVRIPAGQPPRTALGYLFIPVIAVCESLGLVSPQPYDEAFRGLERAVEAWGADRPFADNDAKRLASNLHGKLAVLYGLGAWQALVANRWKGQINENAKNMTFANAFPELNHNEILGWVRAGEQGVRQWAAVVLEDGSESAKMKARAETTLRLIGDLAETHRARARGGSLLERMLTLVLMGDFVSLYMAALNAVDPENIDWINVLKSELAQVG